MKLIVTEPVAISLGGVVKMLRKNDQIVVSEHGSIVDEDIEVIVNSERYLLENGDKIVIESANYEMKPVLGTAGIDRLIMSIYNAGIGWDVSKHVFKKLVGQHVGDVPDSLDKWINLVESAGQPKHLIEHLKALTIAQYGYRGLTNICEDAPGTEKTIYATHGPYSGSVEVFQPIRPITIKSNWSPSRIYIEAAKVMDMQVADEVITGIYAFNGGQATAMVMEFSSESYIFLYGDDESTVKDHANRIASSVLNFLNLSDEDDGDDIRSRELKQYFGIGTVHEALREAGGKRIIKTRERIGSPEGEEEEEGG